MTILIDNGHGKNTPGKRSPDGRLLEWKYTREIASEVVDKLNSMGYKAVLITPEERDIGIGTRSKRVNSYCSKGSCILVSIHCNAAGSNGQWMTGRGWEAWTTKGLNNSDKLAEYLYRRAEKNFIGMKIRKDTFDGDSDKEANFLILREANCPAVLTENFFQDNKEDVDYMLSEQGRHQIIRTHIEGIIDYIESKKG